jgi:putative membrane protein
MGKNKGHGLHWLFLAVVGIIFAWSAIRPHDYFTWFLEVAPVLAALPVLLLTYRRFRLTDLVYGLIAFHAVILIIGGHYTYAEMPLFNWLRDAFELSRNHYDRLGHFVQGFVPAIIVREVLLRNSPLRRGKWLSFVVGSVCLAVSAIYELIEWAVAVATGEGATAFLGTQGDVWDTQTDMFLCLVGAIVSLLVLSRVHDRLLASLERS